MRDFSLPKYEQLCHSLRDSGYVGVGMADYLTREPEERPELVVLLRHDVEWGCRHALRLGACERRLGFVASYFYRIRCLSLDRQAVREMAQMGHEIGYHYATVTQSRGDLDQAVRLFREELEQLRALAPVRIASMHGSPLLPWDNRDVWKQASPQDFGLVGEAYRDIDFSAVAYFSDTGRTWHPRRYNIRDRADASPGHEVDTTDELMELIRSRRLPRLCLLTHPERWPASLLRWGLQGCADVAANVAKLAVAAWYRRGQGEEREGGSE